MSDPQQVWTLPLFQWAFRRNKVRLSRADRWEHARIQTLKYQQNRVQAMKLAKRRGRHTRAEWQALLAFCDHRCVACGEVPMAGWALTRDHIISVRLGGSDAIGNIQPLCMKCNCIKGNLGGSQDHRPAGWENALRGVS
jgi:5-methylcytosine-specific restriction endonuclease McrA